MLVNGWHANHIFGNWIITEMLFLECASVGPMLGQADISTLAQRRTNGWITIGMFTGAQLPEWDDFIPSNPRDVDDLLKIFEDQVVKFQGQLFYLE